MIRIMRTIIFSLILAGCAPPPDESPVDQGPDGDETNTTVSMRDVSPEASDGS